jgi:hypothetical protein
VVPKIEQLSFRVLQVVQCNFNSVSHFHKADETYINVVYCEVLVLVESPRCHAADFIVISSAVLSIATLAVRAVPFHFTVPQLMQLKLAADSE